MSVPLISFLRALFRADPAQELAQAIETLSANATLLSPDDRKFATLMRERTRDHLPILDPHARKIWELSKELDSLLAW